MRRSVRFLITVSLFGHISLAFAKAPPTKRAWLNPPKTWIDREGKISVSADPKSDFWRLTATGTVADSGHFYFEERAGNFTVTVKLKADFAAQYDQAGLMIRIDEKNWIKTGVEFVDGRELVSTVVTRAFSDGSVLPLKELSKPVWMKLTRKGDFVEIHYSLDNRTFQVVRQAYFPPNVACKVGVMAAAPMGTGFKTVFENLEIAAAQ
jgi:uncharacterized protein